MEKTEIKKTIVAVSITTFCVLLFSVLMILSSYVPSVRPQVLGANTYSPQNSFVDEISIFAGGQEKIYTVSELLNVAFGYSDNENSRIYLSDVLDILGYNASVIEITTELGATIQYDLNSALESPYIIIEPTSIGLTNEATFPSIINDIETITVIATNTLNTLFLPAEDEITIFAGGDSEDFSVSELLSVAFGYSDNENSRVYLADILNNLGYSANEIEITTELGATIQYDLNSALESPYIIIGASSIRLTNQATFPSITDDIETITINN